MSVMRCGDPGCPCRNLPLAVDDTEALRAEVERLRAVVGRVRELVEVYAEADEPDGSTSFAPTKWVAMEFRAALDGGAAT